MNIKMIAADLDGTLLNSHSELSPFTRSVLKTAAQRDIRLVVATGRPFYSMPASVFEFKSFDYAISSNGSSVYDLKSGALLKSFTLPAASVHTLSEFALTRHLGFELICGGRAYGEKLYFEHPERFGFDARSIRYLHATRTKIDDLEQFLAQKSTEIESVNFVLPDVRENEAIRQHFRADSALYITSSHPLMIEFSSKDCGKANALSLLLEREGIAPENLAAFGNGENDLEMLALAHCAAATANSVPPVLAQAPHICGACDDDGVAKYILENILS